MRSNRLCTDREVVPERCRLVVGFAEWRVHERVRVGQ